jgi:hypothetical protein
LLEDQGAAKEHGDREQQNALQLAYEGFLFLLWIDRWRQCCDNLCLVRVRTPANARLPGRRSGGRDFLDWYFPLGANGDLLGDRDS